MCFLATLSYLIGMETEANPETLERRRQIYLEVDGDLEGREVKMYYKELVKNCSRMNRDDMDKDKSDSQSALQTGKVCCQLSSLPQKLTACYLFTRKPPNAKNPNNIAPKPSKEPKIPKLPVEE